MSKTFKNMTLYTADFFGFIRTLVIIVLFYYLFKFAFRILAPILVNKMAKKAEENFRQQQQSYYRQNQNNTQQQTNHSTSKKELREKKKVGEYIDFEEID